MSLAITRYLDAGYPVLYVRTTEHNRALDEILANLKAAGLLDSLTVMVWKSTVGLYNVTSACPKEDVVAEDLKSSLEYIAGTRGAPASDRLYIIFNPKEFLKNPVMLQQIKDTAYAIRSAASHIIMVGCSIDIPEEIEDVVTTIDMELPDKETIKGIFRSVTNEYASELDNQVTERDLDVAADNALGLSAFKAENAISLSIVESKGIDIGLIRKEKQLAVKQSGVLEYIHHTETVDSLGGFDVLKDHVSKRKRYFSNHKEAVEFGLRPPKGIMLVGVAGCLSGDTTMLYRRGSRPSGRSIRLEDLYKKFNAIKTSTRPWAKDCDTYLQSYDTTTERVFYNKVLNVVDMGVKRCVTIHTNHAGSMTLTLDHPVLCSDGLFHPAEQITVGTELLVRGSMKARGTAEATHTPRRPRVVVEALKYHPTGWKKSVVDRSKDDLFGDVTEYDYVRQHRARLVIEAHMNRLPLHEFIHILKTDEAKASELVYLPKEAEVHHLDEDPSNDTLSNLMVMTKQTHTAHHCGEERFNKEYVKTAKVTQVEYAGEIPVYDISMQEPACNFISEQGIIVHNTGKSLAAKAVSAALELPLYKFDVGSVFKGVVGGSEAALRNALKLAETVSPCVMLLDEMEKLLAGVESSGKTDSGVTSRVIGTLISWMQETKAPIYKLATCNTIRNLDAALFRRGRWDAVFAVDLPNAEERKQIIAIHLQKRGRSVDSFDLERIAGVTENFVGAEIESVVDEAMYIAFDAERDMTTDDLVTVANGVVPISRTDQEAIQSFRQWMETRATPVSKVVVQATAPNIRNLRIA